MATISIDRLANGTVKIEYNGKVKYVVGKSAIIDPEYGLATIEGYGVLDYNIGDTITINGNPAPDNIDGISEVLANEVFFFS